MWGGGFDICEQLFCKKVESIKTVYISKKLQINKYINKREGVKRK